MDRIVSMQSYCRVVMRRSFSRAARDLGISPAMVTRHVADLERHLGLRLLNRTTRRVSPTESGMHYFRKCQVLLDAIEEVEFSLREPRAQIAGLLRLSCPLDFGLLVMTPVLAGFVERFPEVRIDADFNDRKINLLEEGFDLAIRIGELDDSSLVSQRLAAISFTCCAAPSYLDRYGAPSTPEQLVSHECITYSISPTPYEWRFSKRGREYAVRVRGRLNTSNGRASVGLAVAGCGIILKPDFLLEDHIRAGRLVPILCDYTIPGSAVHALYPHREFLPARVSAFVNSMRESLAREFALAESGR